MSVELGLAVVATVDICIKYGGTLVNLYKAFKNVELELDQRVTRLENAWLRTSVQLRFLQRIWEELDEYHRTIQSQSLHVFNSKLEVAISKVKGLLDQKVVPSGTQPPPRDHASVKLRRWKYALFKESIDKAIKNLEEWQRIFDPSWFLIMRMPSLQIDAELVSLSESETSAAPAPIKSASRLRDALKPEPNQNVSVFRSPDELELATIIPVDHCSVQLAQRKGSSKWLILETMTRQTYMDPKIFRRDVRNLARKLHGIDALTFGLLACKGVVARHDTVGKLLAGVTFVYEMPSGLSDPQSLRSCLNRQDRRSHSLSERFRLAKELAKAVSYIHTFGFVHKNVRPETILVLSDGITSLGSLFLVGLEDFRTAAGRTMRIGVSAWERDLYLHPSRQGSTPEADYVMQHDIYSLGVCLLEIGLWQSFVEYKQDGVHLSPSERLGGIIECERSHRPQTLKEHLLLLARTELQQSMGTRYSDIVQNCLTCLDEDNLDFGNESEFEDDDGVVVGVRYIEKINEIHV